MSERQSGTVKWFNDAKGFGFITPESGPDLFGDFAVLGRVALLVPLAKRDQMVLQPPDRSAVRRSSDRRTCRAGRPIRAGG